MPEESAVLVVGAGPAGTATAIRLARAGHRVILADKSAFPRDKCCSEYASPETLRELERLGVLATIDAQPWTALTGTTVHGPRGAVLAGRFAGADVTPFRPTGKALPRRELDALLLEAARDAGVIVRERHRLDRLGPWQAGRRRATLAGPDGTRDVMTRIVIGADGLRSRVARFGGLRPTGGLRRLAFVAHVEGVAGMRQHAELHVGAGSYVGLNPIDAAITNVAVVVRADAAVEARGDAAAIFLRMLDRHPEIAARVRPGRLVGKVMASGPFDTRARRSTAPGVALVGDAADFFDPFTGEGIWAALVGARLLAETLDAPLRRETALDPDALAPYRRARRRTFADKWLVERTIGHAMRWPALFDAALRRLDRADLGDTMIGISGDFVPASRILQPDALWKLMTARANGERRTEKRDGRRVTGNA